jgi:sulfite reductase (NADPH) hemoprotein beta-component
LKDGPSTLTEAEIARVASAFAPPVYETLPADDLCHSGWLKEDKAFARWVERNVHTHRITGYASVSLSLKAIGRAPGDCSAGQLEAIADMAEHFGFGQVRVAHDQNLILPDVAVRDLYTLWHRARASGVATASVGLLGDLISCPGGDFCGLANARSLPIASAIQERFEDLDLQHDIGPLDLRISGCINACGHHHVGHVGILGVDKNGDEWYQITLGGNSGNARDTALGRVIGPSVPADRVPDAVEALIANYLEQRTGRERFIDTLHRIGTEPFRQSVYQPVSSNLSEHPVTNSNERKIVNG